MAQSEISNTRSAFGVIGEFSRPDRQDAFGAILNSATEANNVVARVFNYVAGSDNQVGVAADGQVAGLLVHPKMGVRLGLSASSYFLNSKQMEIARSGYAYVYLPAAADLGDYVYYSSTTGELQTKPQDTAPDAGYVRVPGGEVVGKVVTAAGIAEIFFDFASGDKTTPSA